MPLYEYVCDACGHRFEIIQKFSDAPPEACPSCGKGPVVRQQASPAIQFKGSGWYITDYARKGQSDTTSTGKSDSSKSDSAKSEGKSETAKSDTTSKTETSAAKTDKTP